MKKKLVLANLIFLLTYSFVLGQNKAASQDSIEIYFNEIRVATKANRQLWNMDLYGPILLVNPDTRQVYANFPDSAGVLKSDGTIYSATWPESMNIANTSIHWGGEDWAMIILPLATDKEPRINLLAHELFHRAQPSLGFRLINKANNHLDQKEGRIYLRLELEALKKAVKATSARELNTHLTNAFTFRKLRYSIYPGADSTENLLELNEGLAEYTGLMISGRNREQILTHIEKKTNAFFANPTFVRSFAYHTIPVYGYLLRDKKKDWNRRVTAQTNLTDLFVDAFGLDIPNELQQRVEAISAGYNGQAIIREETARAEQRKKLIAGYKKKFIEEPHFEIPFEKMSVSFDPRTIVPVEDKGTVYPDIRVTDNWGILTAEKGALISPGWDKIVVTIPIEVTNEKISGDGWTLELLDGYTVTKDDGNGNFKLMKR